MALTRALMDFKEDKAILFNKSLFLILSKEFSGAEETCLQILDKMEYKNAILINLFIAQLHLKKYSEILKRAYLI